MRKQTNFILSLTLAASLAAPAAFAEEKYKSYSYADASTDNLMDAGILGGASAAASKAVDPMKKMITQVLLDSDYPAQLTKANIGDIMAKVRTMPMATTGVGALGGGEIVIVFDEAQVTRVAAAENMKRSLNAMPTEELAKLGVQFAGGPLRDGVVGDMRTGQAPGIDAIENGLKSLSNTKPSFKAYTLNVRTATPDGIEKQLTQIMESGASVKYVAVKGLAGRLAPKALGAASTVSLVASLERVAMAGVNVFTEGRWDSDYCSKSRGRYDQWNVPCEQPSLLKRLYNSAPQAAWEAQEHNRQLDAKKGK